MLFDKSTFDIIYDIKKQRYTLNKYPELIFIDNLLNVHFPILPTLSYICEQITDEMIINYINEYINKINFKFISYIVKFIQFRNYRKYNDFKYVDWWNEYEFDEFELKMIETFTIIFNDANYFEKEAYEYLTTDEIMKLVRKKLTHIRTYYDDDYIKHKLQKALDKSSRINSKIGDFEYFIQKKEDNELTISNISEIDTYDSCIIYEKEISYSDEFSMHFDDNK